MELGILRSELNEMSDDEVLRKWVIGIELADRRKEMREKENAAKAEVK